MTAILLALTTAIMLLPMSALAAPKKEYVSDVMTFTATSFDEAKTGLEKLGYTIVDDSNLNGSLKLGVYLGYKTTTDPDKALTDLAVMNMKGDFSEAEYKEIMSAHRERVEAHMNEQLSAIAAFQSNYKKGIPSALNAFEGLNHFTEDVINPDGVAMGDYLLGFDFSGAAKSDLTDIFMKGNTDIIKTVETLLMLASEPGEDTFIERISDKSYDDIEEEYIDEYGDYFMATNEMSARYDSSALALMSGWTEFRQYLLDTERDFVIRNSDGTVDFNADKLESELLEHLDEDEAKDLPQECADYVNSTVDISNSIVKNNALSAFSLYCLLTGIEYGDETLYDLFTRAADEVEIYELYPLIDAMNAVQRAQLPTLGIKTLLTTSLSDLELRHYDNSDAKTLDESVVQSVYSGVDLSIFDDGVALTGEAEKHELLSGENWFASIINGTAGVQDYQTAFLITSVVSLSSLITYGILYIMEPGPVPDFPFEPDRVYQFEHIAEPSIDTGRYATAHLEDFMSEADDFFDECSEISRVEDSLDESGELYRNLLNNSELTEEAQQAAEISNTAGSSQLSTFFRYASFFIFIISFALDIYLVWKLMSAEKAVESEIPHHMVTAENTRELSTFVYYSAAKDQNGAAADLNAHKGDKSIGWLTLYCTRDSKAGSPIEAGSLVVKHTANAGSGSCVHLFGETGAANVTAKTYTGVSDTTGGTYVFFTRDVNAYTASSFSDSRIAIAGAGGLVVGLLLGLIPLFVRKRRNNDEQTEA